MDAHGLNRRRVLAAVGSRCLARDRLARVLVHQFRPKEFPGVLDDTAHVFAVIAPRFVTGAKLADAAPVRINHRNRRGFLNAWQLEIFKELTPHFSGVIGTGVRRGTVSTVSMGWCQPLKRFTTSSQSPTPN